MEHCSTVPLGLATASPDTSTLPVAIRSHYSIFALIGYLVYLEGSSFNAFTVPVKINLSA